MFDTPSRSGFEVFGGLRRRSPLDCTESAAPCLLLWESSSLRSSWGRARTPDRLPSGGSAGLRDGAWDPLGPRGPRGSARPRRGGHGGGVGLAGPPALPCGVPRARCARPRPLRRFAVPGAARGAGVLRTGAPGLALSPASRQGSMGHARIFPLPVLGRLPGGGAWRAPGSHTGPTEGPAWGA